MAIDFVDLTIFLFSHGACFCIVLSASDIYRKFHFKREKELGFVNGFFRVGNLRNGIEVAVVSRLRNLGGNDLLFPAMGTSKPCPRRVTVRDEESQTDINKKRVC